MNAPGGIGAARYTGQRVPRKEDPRLLTGRGQFVDDISLPGMLHCAFVRTRSSSRCTTTSKLVLSQEEMRRRESGASPFFSSIHGLTKIPRAATFSPGRLTRTFMVLLERGMSATGT